MRGSIVLFPSVTLCALLSWPFVAAWLLWVSGRSGRASGFAYSGAVLSLLGLLGCSHGLGIEEVITLAIESTVPLFLCSQTVVQGRLTSGVGERLSFLVVGCAFMAFYLRSELLVIVFVGIGVALVSWWDSRFVRRALPAWSMARLRFSGCVLSTLGTAIMQGCDSFPGAVSAQTLGSVFSVIGLCMMVGIGSAASDEAERDILDTGLRFSPIILMMHTAVHPFAHHLLMCAGLLALFVAMVGTRRVFSVQSCFTSLAVVAASCNQEFVVVLLFAVALLMAVLQCQTPLLLQKSGSCIFLQSMSLPIIGLSVLSLSSEMNVIEVSALLVCVSIGVRNITIIPSVNDVRDFWYGTYCSGRVALVGVGVLTVLGVCFMGWRPHAGWRL